MAVDAMRWADGFVILDAIRQRMDGESSPRWIPEWAREAQSEKYRALHAERMASEREVWDDVDPEVRRVMVAVARAKSRGQTASLQDVTCVECRQFTETKCPNCSRALHARACPTRHACSALVSSPHNAPEGGIAGVSAVDPDETTAVRASALPLGEAVPAPPLTVADQANGSAAPVARAHQQRGGA